MLLKLQTLKNTLTKEQEELEIKLLNLNQELQDSSKNSNEEYDLVNLRAFSMRSYNYTLLAHIRLIDRKIKTITELE